MNTEIVVRIPRNAVKALLMGLAILASATDTQSTESVQLTTYYPAPSGVYQQMLTTSNAYLATTGGVAIVGAVTNTGGNKLYVEGSAGVTANVHANGYMNAGSYVSGAQVNDRNGCFSAGGLNRCISSPTHGMGGWYPYAVYAP